jgi:hypothetical protein
MCGYVACVLEGRGYVCCVSGNTADGTTTLYQVRMASYHLVQALLSPYSRT